MDIVDWSAVYSQALPYAEQFLFERYRAYVLLFAAFAMFSVFGFLSTRGKPPLTSIGIPAGILVLGVLISGGLTMYTISAYDPANVYVLRGTVTDRSLSADRKSQFLALDVEQAFTVSADGERTEHAELEDRKEPFVLSRGRPSAAADSMLRDTARYIFQHFYETLQEGDRVTFVLVMRKDVVGVIDDQGKLVIPDLPETTLQPAK